MNTEQLRGIRARLDALLVINWYDREAQPASAHNADQLLADAKALLALVDEYARHKPGCWLMTPRRTKGPASCNCGLTEAMEALNHE